MPESKHVLTSKLFLTGLVTLLSGVAMAIAGHYGVSLDINPTIQGGLVTVIGGLVMYWRNRPTKALHVKRPKKPGVVESKYTFEDQLAIERAENVLGMGVGVKSIYGGGVRVNSARVAADRLKADK